MKKLISSALSLIMLIGAMGITSVSAADTDVTVSENFNGLTLEKSATVTDSFYDKNYSDDGTANTTRRINYYTVAGQYGKTEDDNCLRIYKPYTDHASNGNLNYRYYQLRYTPNLTGGNYYHASAEFAFETSSNNPALTVWCDDMTICDMEYDSTNAVYNVVVNGETKATIPTEQWTKLDVVIDAANQNADLYLDGVEVASDIALSKEITGLTELQIRVRCVYVWNSTETKKAIYYGWNVYMDNLECSALAEEPEIDRKSEDFNDLELEQSTAVTDDFYDINYSDNVGGSTARRIFYYTSAGQYGKEAEDKCLHINKIWANYAYDNSSHKYYQLRYKPELTGGNYYHVSTELAFAKDGNSPEIVMWCDDMRICNMIYDTTDHTYDVLVNEEVKATVPTEEWVKFDIVINASAQTANLYIDGHMVASDIALANEITGLTQFQLGVYCKTTYNSSDKKTAYYGWNVYMDNLECISLVEEPVIEPEEEIPTDMEITAVGEAEVQENATDLYKKGFKFTTDNVDTFNSIILEDDGEVVGGFNIRDKFETIISGGAVELGLQVYDIPEALKDLTAKLSTETIAID